VNAPPPAEFGKFITAKTEKLGGQVRDCQEPALVHPNSFVGERFVSTPRRRDAFVRRCRCRDQNLYRASCKAVGEVRSWRDATGDILTARRRFRGIADMDRFSSRNDLWRVPSRPREFHPEPLTDSGRDTLASSGSCHRTKAAAFR